MGNCRGPGRLCSALGIDRRHNGLDLCPDRAPDRAPELTIELTPRLTIEDRGTKVPDSAIKFYEDRFVNLWRFADAQLARTQYLAGNEITAADLAKKTDPAETTEDAPV